MAPIAMELNLFIDTILEKVRKFANGRSIILSSFTPAVCMLLAVKQKAYPIMFITNAGKVPMFDREARAASLQMAVKFAERWGLSGLVLACDTYLYCPRLVQFVKNLGFMCATYGALNSDPTMAKVRSILPYCPPFILGIEKANADFPSTATSRCRSGCHHHRSCQADQSDSGRIDG